MPNAPLIAIVGETACGKTAAAIELAKRVGGEIISADSWAVYRGFDIGTAKPDAAERQQVRFHLIDVVDAPDGFSAAEFKRLAQAAIQDIIARGKVPIIAGGTGLYVDAVLYDFSFLPSGEPAARDMYNAMSLDGLLALVGQQGIDTTGIDLRNKRRIIRLLETNGQRPVHQPLRQGTFYAGIRVDKDTLQERIAKRTDAMLAAGLEAEVRQLAERYGWDVEPMKGIGYREWQLQFEGNQTLQQTRERIIAATAGLAKRQRTWFKRNNDIVWFDDPTQLITHAQTFLNTQ